MIFIIPITSFHSIIVPLSYAYHTTTEAICKSEGPFTSIQLTFRGANKVINNVVVDTGAAETIISPDVVEDIGLIAELNDTVSSFYGIGGSLHNCFSKRVDQVSFGGVNLEDLKLDFGVIDPKGEINGLLGLDLLIKAGAVINLNTFTLTIDKL